MDDLIEITVTLKTQAVQEAVARAWSALMSSTAYERNEPEGYAHIKAQVLKHCLRIDATELIKRAVERQLEPLVEDVVGKTLRDAITKQAKLLRDSGRLFEGGA